MGSPYYRDMDEPTSPAGAGHHRSRSASRPPMAHAMDYPRTRYQSLDRGGLVDPHDREFIPIREPRDRSRDRSLERGLYLEDELYGRSARQSPSAMGGYNTGMGPTSDRAYLGDLQHQNTDLQRELGNLKRELELTNQKLGSSMHSIKTFWSPELKKERALRKEESAKYSLINDQLKLLSTENQKQAMLVRQLEEELRLRMRQPNLEMQQQMEAIYAENDHLQREISILRETIKDLECRVETQKQTLIARDESIKKLLEMLQAKGMGKEEERQMFQQMQAMAQKQMYNNYTGASGSSPPLPDIIGQYYGPGSLGPGPLSYGSGNGYGPPGYDLYGPSTSTAAGGYGLYDPQIYGPCQQTSPIRRRRYSIAGLPSATMYNDVYGYPAPPLQQTSSSNIVNLLNEAHKSISRSSQILNLTNQARQLGQLVTTPLGGGGVGMGLGRVVSSYPTLHPGDTSPPYLNDNLMQMSTSFSSQPNMYFQPQAQVQQVLPTQLTAAQSAAAAAARLRPAYSVTNLVSSYPTTTAAGYGCKYGGYGNPYQSDLGYGNPLAPFQQRQLMAHQSLHASNPAISQYYQNQGAATGTGASAAALAYNLQQQFAGTQHYGGGSQGPPLGHSYIQASVQQQMHPQYQYHVHQHQNHLQTHPLAALANTSGPFGGTLASSARDYVDGLHHAAHSHTHPHSHPHHSSHHSHHTAYPHSHSHHQQQQPHQAHHHHHLPYSKLDLDYPKLPQEHKRQVSFKFDVDTLSLDS
uniref:IP11737p n=1 Tax=Drosophila melanogaster TaxID=7227 RepID=A2RVE0_DROME|nr:IP11737p [Drosophila melanogaster]